MGSLPVVAYLYLAYLALLVVVPPIVQWRRGIVGGFIVTVAELALVALVVYGMETYHLVPKIEREQPFQNPEGRSSWDQAVGGLLIYAFIMIPGAAAICGGALAVTTGIARAIWQSARKRGTRNTV